MRSISLEYRAGQQAAHLLLLLPPAMASLEDMQAQGFVAAVRQRALDVDILLLDISNQEVMAGTVAESLHRQLNKVASGYAHVWMAGISLGAFNALHYAARHAGSLSGMALLAPYPGTGDVLQEIRQAGGPQAWAAQATGSQADERTWWRWLAGLGLAGAHTLPLYLGLGEQDRFIKGQEMMADLLRPDSVYRMAGTHSWPVWLQLWTHWLDHGPLAARERLS